MNNVDIYDKIDQCNENIEHFKSIRDWKLLALWEERLEILIDELYGLDE